MKFYHVIQNMDLEAIIVEQYVLDSLKMAVENSPRPRYQRMANGKGAIHAPRNGIVNTGWDETIRIWKKPQKRWIWRIQKGKNIHFQMVQ